MWFFETERGRGRLVVTAAKIFPPSFAGRSRSHTSQNNHQKALWFLRNLFCCFHQRTKNNSANKSKYGAKVSGTKYPPVLFETLSNFMGFCVCRNHLLKIFIDSPSVLFSQMVDSGSLFLTSWRVSFRNTVFCSICHLSRDMTAVKMNDTLQDFRNTNNIL